MRAISILTVAALGLSVAACKVTEDKNNQETSVEFNDQIATNAVADVGNAATNIAGTIAADAKREAGKVQEKVGDVDVNLKINRDGNSAVTANTVNSQ